MSINEELEMSVKRIPAKRFHPGIHLKREIDARGWSQKDLADIMGRPEQVISEIINGTKQITPETAIELSKALGISAQIWINLEANYQMWKAHQAKGEGSIERRARLYGRVPVSELKHKGWLPDTKDIDALESSYLQLMGVSSISEVPQCAICKRQSKTQERSILPEVIWVKRVEQLITKQKVRKYNPVSFIDAIPDLLTLSCSIEDVVKIPEFLLNHGIHFAMVPHLSTTKIDGAYFRFEDSPVIALTLRYDRIDSFWFTLMHEITHMVKNHHETVESTYDRTDKIRGVEAEADKMAMRWLVDDDKYHEFVKTTAPYYTSGKISRFAEQIDRHPGLVLGRLHYDGFVPFKNLRKLLVKVKPYLMDYFDKPIEV